MSEKILRKRDKWRNNECAGCRNNYYNFPKPVSSKGDAGVAEDGCCWSLSGAKKDKKTGKAKCNTAANRPGYRDSALRKR